MTYVLVPGKNCGGYSPCIRYWYVDFDFLPSRPPYVHGCTCHVEEMADAELPHGRTMAECEYIELMLPEEWESLFGRVRSTLLRNGDLTVKDLIGPRGGPVPELGELGFCQSGKRLTPEQHAMAKADVAARGTSHTVPIHEAIVTEEDRSSGWGIAFEEKAKPSDTPVPTDGGKRSNDTWWGRLLHRGGDSHGE